MRNLVLIAIAVVLIFVLLRFFGFIDLSPEGEQALENAQDSVGGAVENAGEAIQDAGEEVQNDN